jgi:hypothetical protein
MEVGEILPRRPQLITGHVNLEEVVRVTEETS